MSLLVLMLFAQAAAPAVPAAPPAYAALVCRAVDAAREGRLAAAEEVLGQAIGEDPARAEAFVERGGVFFLQERYAEAAQDLKEALARGEDAHARALLAASLHLAGREDEALSSWNRLGEPRVRGLEITGLRETRDEVARRELRFHEGERLDRDDVRESRMRLAETGAFERVRVRAEPRGDGTADIEVALVERHGLASSRAELAVGTIASLADRRLGLRYANVGGRGASVFGSWRFAPHRPEVALGLTWPRPFGLDVNLGLGARRGLQGYRFEEPVERTSRGLDLSLRRVLGASTVGELGFSLRDRAFSATPPSAVPGLVAGPHVALERRLLDGARDRVDSSVRGFASLPALGADLSFARALASLRYERFLGPATGASVVARALAGVGTDTVPLDEGFGLGGGPESPFPLRAHRQFEDGVAGAAPLGRSLLLFNAEWRQPLLSIGPVRVGLAVFHDAGRASRGQGDLGWLHDSGLGMRLSLQSTVIRIDFAHGWVDDANALTLGVGQAF